jgi:sugar diacid utilization regulator
LRRNLDLLGPAVLIGVSTDQPSTAFIPRALHEAVTALDFASVERRVMQYADVSIRRLLLHRGAEHVRGALPSWMDAFDEADERASGGLRQTLGALADADLNVQQAARALRLHPNTIYARLARIGDCTGLDPRRYHDLTELLLCTECRTTRPRR